MESEVVYLCIVIFLTIAIWWTLKKISLTIWSFISKTYDFIICLFVFFVLYEYLRPYGQSMVRLLDDITWFYYTENVENIDRIKGEFQKIMNIIESYS